MNMRIGPSITPLPAATPLRRTEAPAAAQGFQGALGNALRAVSEAQNQASAMQTEVVRGNPAVGLEETMVAMQKAQLSFQSALHVRNRMVQAYSDIMNMQV